MKWNVVVPGQPPTTNKMYSAKMRSIWRDGIRMNVPQMVKNSKVEKYQHDAIILIQNARPSRWRPEGFVRLTFRLFLVRNIDADNTLKALSDAIQNAIGVNDSWFLPCVESKEWGLSQRDARVEIDLEDLPRVAFAGSGTLTGKAALPALYFLLKLDDPVLLLRRGISTQPGVFEFSLQLMAKTMGWAVEWFVPAPGGRDQVFFRDIDMVANADVVICVFHGDTPMEGGTAHVVEKAQDRRVPVYAYTDDGDGAWTRLGEWDPDEAWAHRVPSG